MTARLIVNWLGPLTVLGAVLLANDLIIEKQIERALTYHPEIITNAVAIAEGKRSSETVSRIQKTLISNWDVLARTRAYAVVYNGSRFTSRLVRLSDIATATNLNLVASDYQCTHCKSDREAVSNLLRAHPNQAFLLIEAPILGHESFELAKDALLQSQRNQKDYYAIHCRHFDSNYHVASSSAVSPPSEADELLAEQKRFLEILGISATPTYVRNGVVRFGTLTT